MTPMVPVISVVICTCSRGSAVLPTLKSVLDSRIQELEVLVVDQSDDDAAGEAIAELRDKRLVHVKSTTRGLSRARNIGARRARAELIAFTDDDCTVPQDWLSRIVELFAENDRVAAVFCSVLPAPHDATAGFVPDYKPGRSGVVRTLWEKRRARGIGAAMALRRVPLLDIGGFDVALGAGAQYRAGEDHDVAVRLLIKGWHECELNEPAVIRHGLRTWAEARPLTTGSWFGIGAVCAKPVKCGHWRALSLIGYELADALWDMLKRLALLRRPFGRARTLYLCWGFLKALREPVGRELIMFAPLNASRRSR